MNRPALEVDALLRAAGLRPTAPRRAVLDTLARGGRALSAQDLFAMMRRRRGGPALATIYRTLSGLAAAGALDTFRRGDEEVFRLCTGAHHHHLVCEECGRVEEVESAEVEAWVARVARKGSFAVREHRAEIFGVCAACGPGA